MRTILFTSVLAACIAAPGVSPSLAQDCTPDPAGTQVVYATGLNSRLFFSQANQVDAPVANPQVLTGLLRPASTDPATLVFGVTLIDYATGAAAVSDADKVDGVFEIHVFPPPATITPNPANTVVGHASGVFFKDFVHHRADFGGKNVMLARVEIPTDEVFRKLPTVNGDPSLALGSVLAVLRDTSGAPIACSYVTPLARHLASNRTAMTPLTTAPQPYVVATSSAAGGPSEVVSVEPANTHSRVGATTFEVGLIANPPAVSGVTTSPANNRTHYDFGLTYIRYSEENGAAQVFGDQACDSPVNPFRVNRTTAAMPYPPDTGLKVRIRPAQPSSSPLGEEIEGAWNGSDSIILPLHDTGDVTRARFYCMARVSVPVCSVERLLGPIPGMDRRVRIGIVEGLHEIRTTDGTVVNRSGFYNPQNRIVAGNRELAEVTSALAQPVIFLVDEEPACQPS